MTTPLSSHTRRVWRSWQLGMLTIDDAVANGDTPEDARDCDIIV